MEVFVPLFPLAIYALSVIQNDFLLLIFKMREVIRPKLLWK